MEKNDSRKNSLSRRSSVIDQNTSSKPSSISDNETKVTGAQKVIKTRCIQDIVLFDPEKDLNFFDDEMDDDCFNFGHVGSSDPSDRKILGDSGIESSGNESRGHTPNLNKSRCRNGFAQKHDITAISEDGSLLPNEIRMLAGSTLEMKRIFERVKLGICQQKGTSTSADFNILGYNKLPIDKNDLDNSLSKIYLKIQISDTGNRTEFVHCCANELQKFGPGKLGKYQLKWVKFGEKRASKFIEQDEILKNRRITRGDSDRS